ncbi:MAG: hypothetical protein KAJ48_06205 [Elusimicrobiales bacterium]|nr:hypothetical protein [Elusimicrobiales bacterium]
MENKSTRKSWNTDTETMRLYIVFNASSGRAITIPSMTGTMAHDIISDMIDPFLPS